MGTVVKYINSFHPPENCLHSQNQGRMTSAQSKGGQAAGHKSNNKSLIMINSYIGRQINDWTVLSIDKETIELNKPRRVICKCMRCSSEQSVLFHSVKTGRSKMCKSCAQKQRHLDKINIQTKI